MGDFGAGCGLGAIWLSKAFGVKVTIVDSFAEHVSAANQAAQELGVTFASSCAGDIAALATFADGTFDAIISNSAIQISRPFAVQCAVLRTHFFRLLRRGGALWWGDLNSPHNTES